MCTFVLVKQVKRVPVVLVELAEGVQERLVPAYVSIRQHTSAAELAEGVQERLVPAYVSIRQHTSAHVSSRTYGRRS